MGSGFATKTITLSCGKLTTGVTVPAVVLDPHAPQPSVTGDVLPGHVPGAITVVDP